MLGITMYRAPACLKQFKNDGLYSCFSAKGASTKSLHKVAALTGFDWHWQMTEFHFNQSKKHVVFCCCCCLQKSSFSFRDTFCFMMLTDVPLCIQLCLFCISHQFNCSPGRTRHPLTPTSDALVSTMLCLHPGPLSCVFRHWGIRMKRRLFYTCHIFFFFNFSCDKVGANHSFILKNGL